MTATPTTSAVPYADRDLRQREIVPPEALAACHALVIGVGAIGRQVAAQLAALGVGSLELVDFDTVDVVNLAPQAYWPSDLGTLKVNATANLCRAIHPDLRLAVRPERFRRSSARTLGLIDAGRATLAVFACVDSIETRRLIWTCLRDRAAFWTDGRMNAEVLRVLASGTPPTDAHYGTTLFPEAEAYRGACTARSTVYTASIAAGLMLSQFTRWARGLPVDRDVTVNLLAMEMAVR